MNIEFIGLPGSGKSTIRKKLLKSLKELDAERYISAEEAFNKVSKYNIDKIYRYPLNILPRRFSICLSNALMNRNLMQHEAQSIFAAKAGKSLDAFLGSVVFDNMSIDDRKIVIGSLFEMGSTWECIKSGIADNHTVLFEEGFVQKSLMFVPTCSDLLAEQERVFDYLDNIPLPDLIIYVEVGVNVSYQRMVGRPDGLTQRLSQLDENTILSFLLRTERHLNMVAEWMCEKCHSKIIVVDNITHIDTSVKQITEAIRAL